MMNDTPMEDIVATPHIKGLVAAAFSPMKTDGSIHTEIIPSVTEHLIAKGVAGIYICGSTGEGPLLSVAERKQVAEAYIKAIDRRIPAIVHVGHDSLIEARHLAQHAVAHGADAIAAVGPSYFKPQRLDMLVAFLAEIAKAAPETDFYYYHIPQLSGNSFDMMEFLDRAPSMIPAFKGIKYSAMTVHQFQQCKEAAGDQYQVFFGCDEMLTSGLAAGADAAIGSTYNLVPRLYREIMEAFARGDVRTARTLQSRAVRMIRVCYHYRGLPAIKALMKWVGFDCGPVRLPLESLTADEYQGFIAQIEALGLRDWV